MMNELHEIFVNLGLFFNFKCTCIYTKSFPILRQFHGKISIFGKISWMQLKIEIASQFAKFTVAIDYINWIHVLKCLWNWFHIEIPVQDSRRFVSLKTDQKKWDWPRNKNVLCISKKIVNFRQILMKLGLIGKLGQIAKTISIVALKLWIFCKRHIFEPVSFFPIR